ncbi:MAG: fimbrillin family protein [Bacteroidaceae bacterium]|nr:fimbrillin family protein [Bacteroidaceae bacterium]
MNTKKFIQILAVSATALITACEERLTSNDYATPITVTSQVSEKTRAGYDNSNLPDKFVMDIYQGGGSYDYSLVEMEREEGSNTYNAPNGTLLLWKGSETNHPNAEIKAMTIPDGTAIDPINPMTIKVNTNQTTDANVKASDLLGAQTGDGITINGHSINIEFRHLLSKLYVNYRFAEGLTGTVNSITLTNACVQGGYSYKDMNYVNSSLSYGDIEMFLYDSKERAAEAIFYPYTPTSTTGDAKLNVSIKVNGVDKTLTCPINLGDNASFEGGKKYIMNILISGTTIENTSIIVVKDWIEDNESVEGIFADKKILWIGTSIPAGFPNYAPSYPELIAQATGCEIVNNAVAGSVVHFFNKYNTLPAAAWTSPQVIDFQPMRDGMLYALSATKAEIESKFNTILTNLAWEKYPENMQGNWWNQYDANEETRNQYLAAIPGHIARLQQYSYEELILPHINGTSGKTQCDVIIIDHGYNDAAFMVQEAIGANGTASTREALPWLESLINGTEYELFSGYRTFCSSMGDGDKISYIAAMNYIIEEIKKANENVQIIIGNHYASRSLNPEDQDAIYTKTNEAVAAINNTKINEDKLPIVNVYEHTGLDAETAELYTQTYGGPEMYNNLFVGYCPDGVHPGSDPHGKLNKMIANIYIEKLKEIFGK